MELENCVQSPWKLAFVLDTHRFHCPVINNCSIFLKLENDAIGINIHPCCYRLHLHYNMCKHK